jgi:hypothetical protein
VVPNDVNGPAHDSEILTRQVHIGGVIITASMDCRIEQKSAWVGRRCRHHWPTGNIIVLNTVNQFLLPVIVASACTLPLVSHAESIPELFNSGSEHQVALTNTIASENAGSKLNATAVDKHYTDDGVCGIVCPLPASDLLSP